MAQGKKVSKNARRNTSDQLISRWGGKIIVRTVFKNGKMKHFAECQSSGVTASKPRELM